METAPTLKVEPFGQGMLTLHWDDVIEALRASGYDDIAIANMSGKLRSQRLISWGLWIDGMVSAIAVTGRVHNDFTNTYACAIHALHGNATKEQWQVALSHITDALKQQGYSSLCAFTDVPRVREICELDGWQTKHFCVKEL